MNLPPPARLPTSEHERAVAAVLDFFAHEPVRAVLLVNSCARGVAVPESDLDLAVLVDRDLPPDERARLERAWTERAEEHPDVRRFTSAHRFGAVHLDLFDGDWQPVPWDDGGGPDAFEIEIGNRVRHAVPLWAADDAFAALQARWLPYYDDDLRARRLTMVRDACTLNASRILAAVERDLLFHAADRLQHAVKEFLQGVFIARRVYPIAYDKWIRDQVEGWLGLPGLYAELAHLVAVGRLRADELAERAERLEALLDMWVPAPAETA